MPLRRLSLVPTDVEWDFPVFGSFLGLKAFEHILYQEYPFSPKKREVFFKKKLFTEWNEINLCKQ